MYNTINEYNKSKIIRGVFIYNIKKRKNSNHHKYTLLQINSHIYVHIYI